MVVWIILCLQQVDLFGLVDVDEMVWYCCGVYGVDGCSQVIVGIVFKVDWY